MSRALFTAGPRADTDWRAASCLLLWLAALIDAEPLGAPESPQSESLPEAAQVLGVCRALAGDGSAPLSENAAEAVAKVSVRYDETLLFARHDNHDL